MSLEADKKPEATIVPFNKLLRLKTSALGHHFHNTMKWPAHQPFLRHLKKDRPNIIGDSLEIIELRNRPEKGTSDLVKPAHLPVDFETEKLCRFNKESKAQVDSLGFRPGKALLTV
jgi:hypothetical protein